MSTDLATQQDLAGVVEQVVVGGDLSKLTPKDRLTYYNAVCRSVGVNPLTRPFSYLTLSGKMVLYANKDCTDQLRGQKGVSITKLERETLDDVYSVTAYAMNKEGRTDSSIGAVNIAGLRGEAKANAVMKAETKAKRRVTLSICGLGMLDETEVESIPDARPARIDYSTGEVLDGNGHTAEEVPPTLEEDLFAASGPPLNEALERSLLLTRCKAAADKLKLDAAKRADILMQFEIRDPREASLDQLNAMLEHLRGMQK